ncbi:MAG: sigma 54-interacting transcriptional regulator [bacterium]
MHPELQAKLLRFLQEREFTPLGSNQARSVDTRVLAATNIDIDKAIESGTFREDLFYRLNVVRISLPPLRERIDDIPDLAYHFLKRYSSDINEDVTDFDDDTLQIFKSYSWPGNVRELENCVKSALTLANGNTISPSDIPNNIKPTTDTDSTNGDHESYKSLNQMEREHILRVLQNEDWNISSASDILDINRTTLYNKIEKYELREHEPS